ncbi:NEDD4-binding protein 2-like 2 isoform X1 [Chiroxiphia lanceolata]|uniref:NEDD4-binding protein 2-like 2 isoform X1 n=1 Tax=Chiroxiphia lanceolata TaxID=296741 RepID=UPI0013CE9459|nr:NEDD4-binding protein 2-like 2 isoform X1 [Chiroxiphia lanceolata]XP_032533280.1 NEDD4-binding protein 2-like 2 isoform X1 [Chiroxiphia lanceolata]XP_032533285.1 NEDD4-binding protein 2-like 2 isoform X1 [Chiroxiphia lanceolata]XP_032533300.1 NEDD4-binding protein 2-like 2 isoform X1 [Chiroxiphia lanceolata]
MLHAENGVRLSECHDEIKTEPYSKRMKSTEGTYEKLPDDDNQGIQQEVDPERTSSDWIPAYASDNQGQHEMQKQEKILTGVLGSLNEVLLENNPVLSQPVDSETVQNVNPPFASINDTKVEEEKDPFITNNASEDNSKKSSTSLSVHRNASDEDFFTSKEFIGPIYKPAKSNKQGESGSCNECRNNGGDENELHENRPERKEAKKMQAVSATVPEIDDELDQFYKEIHQLENERLDTNPQGKESETSQEQQSPYNCSQSSQEDCQHILLDSPQPFYENGQRFLGEQNSQKTSNEQQFVVETDGWKTENTFNGQVDAKSWNCSVPEFRPAWQTRASFVVPQGPLLPGLNHQSHFQTVNSPPQIPNALPFQNGSYYRNSYCRNTDINNHGPLLDQNTSYASHIDIHTTQVFRNENNGQKGLQNNGFCETREECWKDPKADNTEGMRSFSSLQLSEERFGCAQKFLLILRGLPGSGKSTLSRILLGQSCDGVVFSTDDYFRQQDGYTYNAAQLGDAHEWNQKRAKQAMEQGRSPVIIDNTNTQAWEMKPYVEVALEKGYRVEFHEPDTWWKFDPEELEKRNKHGVTREKIAQMLERYEYQISIPIVMNSVVPSHKSTQRPPLQRRHRETILKTVTGHPLTKAKQKKKRKRNKTMETNHTEIMKKMLHGVDRYPAPGDQDRSESEEEDVEEENRKSLCTFSKGPEDPVIVCEEQPNSDDESLREAAGVSRERFLVAVPEVSMMSNSALKNELPVESDSSLLIDVKLFSTENLTKNAFNDEEANQRHRENLCRSSFLKISNDENSIHETEGISEDNVTSLLSIEEKTKSCQITCEPDLEAKLISLNSEEKQISQCYNSKVLDVVPDNNTEGKGALKAEETSSNARACFSVNLSTEELQLGFDTQVSLSPWSEDKFVGEQRPPKMRKPKLTQTNSSQLNCDQSKEGLVKEKHYETETEEFGNIISNGMSASPAGEVHFDSLVEARATFMQCSSKVNVLINDATPITLKRKRCRRIVNLAPKFNLPREIADHTEGGKEVPVKENVPQKSVLEVKQKNLLSKDRGDAHEQDSALQEYFAPYSDTKATSSLPTPDADALLHNISHIHSGQCSPISKYSCSVCVASRAKEEQTTTLKMQEVVDKKEDESEQVSSEVTNGQPDILSSVKIVSEYPEDSNILASCSEKVNEADDPEPAEASQLEDNQDVDVKCSFLGLPLSLGFAFQLVQLFGSPGLPLESLLPDDFIVPLDWKVSKMIYLQWKTSVEEKEKANGLQNGNSLTDDIISLEDLNKIHQENQDSSETLPGMELFQGMIEENIMTCTSTGCLDAAFHQS